MKRWPVYAIRWPSHGSLLIQESLQTAPLAGKTDLVNFCLGMLPMKEPILHC